MVRRLFVCLVLLAACAPELARGEVEQLPIIVTYELRQARITARAEARDPHKFWLHQIVTRIADAAGAEPGNYRSAIVLLSFSVDREGHLIAPKVAKSSGKPAADAAALGVLKSAQPFPPMPAPAAEPVASFTVPIRFR